MTSFKPWIVVKRMVVKQGNRTVYNASFHPRLNIVSGENSSGKSTILDFLFYGLGGEIYDWREAALACSEVVIEVLFNGHSAILAREISQQTGRPMRIFLGEWDQGFLPDAAWGLYPYKRSLNKESFSQVIFRLMGMPEATGDASSNITMHQILRLLYADQLSPVDRIFRFERFDTALTRQTVGDLLCGAYDNTLYRHQLRLRDANKELENVTNEWKSSAALFAHTKHAITLDWLNAERIRLNEQLNAVRTEAEELEEKIFNAEVSDGLTLNEQKHAYQELVQAQKNLFSLQEKRDALDLEMADSDQYIHALEVKLEELQDAEITAQYLNGIEFIYCPSCYAPIEDNPSEHSCSLCKSPFDKERARSRILAIINETGIQIKQSNKLQEDRKKEALELDSEFSKANIKWSGLAQRYKFLNRLPSTELRLRARVLYSKAGYLEREIEDLAQKGSLIERLDALSKAKSKLMDEIRTLNDEISSGEIRQKNQLSRAYTLISDNVCAFLRHDLLRQDTFSKAENIYFSFGDDRMSVNGEGFFSASSMVYLRNSFFAGFLQSAIQDSSFRHPRFLIMDTIEDKGMEPKRSHHFQNLLAEMSLSAGVENQLIYATAMISPDLEKTEYIVDRFYTHDDRTLKV
ncbi:ATP-binding protein [Acetobacter persici]|uniref:Rad50/SbcC-type AAA domain-containing protein n=2 Tax=Acetobacter persici TaxID=1076596 RepID=A0A6V8IAX0_9PROT|nr:ATP-binding protein [Acetobacter persici]OUI91218.1 hypothetical protein HK19_07805 [Acetobacter persici]GFE94731.1 hypothetical protein DmAi_27900 [Acetobacter persici]